MNEVTQCAGPVSTNAGLISCAGVTGSGCITYHAYATLLSGLKMSPETQQPPVYMKTGILSTTMYISVSISIVRGCCVEVFIELPHRDVDCIVDLHLPSFHSFHCLVT